MFFKDYIMIPPKLPDLSLQFIETNACNGKKSPEETSPRKRSPSREVFEASLNSTHDQLRLAAMSMGPSTPRAVQKALESLEEQWVALRGMLQKDSLAAHSLESRTVDIEDKTMKKIDDFIFQLQSFQHQRRIEIEKTPIVGSPQSPHLQRIERSEQAFNQALQSIGQLSRTNV